VAEVAVVMNELSQYLADVSRGKWGYGALDCCTFMADWLMRLGFADPMADRRGTYATHREYRAPFRAEGGILGSCKLRFGALGLSETGEPDTGAVALVMAPYAIKKSGKIVRFPTGAICTRRDRFAVVTSDKGLVVSPFPLVAAWSIARG
jgi:hypothetical protein